MIRMPAADRRQAFIRFISFSVFCFFLLSSFPFRVLFYHIPFRFCFYSVSFQVLFLLCFLSDFIFTLFPFRFYFYHISFQVFVFYASPSSFPDFYLFHRYLPHFCIFCPAFPFILPFHPASRLFHHSVGSFRFFISASVLSAFRYFHQVHPLCHRFRSSLLLLHFRPGIFRPPA